MHQPNYIPEDDEEGYQINGNGDHNDNDQKFNDDGKLGRTGSMH